MKKRHRTPKQTTLPAMIAKALGMTALLTVVFAFGFQTFLTQYLHSQANMQLETQAADTQQRIQKLNAKYEGDILMQEIRCNMTMHQIYTLMIEDPFGREEKSVYLAPVYSPKCHAGAALIDQNNEIVASNELKFMGHIAFSPEKENDPANGWYVCDRNVLDLPEVHQLFDDYLALSQHMSSSRYVQTEIESAYVDKENHIFIPHKGSMTVIAEPDHYEPLIVIDTSEKCETKEINITLDDARYELVTLHGINGEYPRSALMDPCGETPKDLAQFQSEFIFRDESSYYSDYYQQHADGTETYYRALPIYLGKEPYWLTLGCTINRKDPTLTAFYWRWTISFALLVLALSLLLSWRDYIIRKNRCAMEEFQCTLTDRLAHDIKTPLMAISGYAENLLQSDLSAEEQQEYLQSILKNVSFTDTLVSQTLYLNHMQNQTQKPEQFRMEMLLEEAVQKYDMLLQEKQISYQISGSTTIRADKNAMEVIIENLISNAVKYTPEHGAITVTLDKKHLIITNTIEKKLDTAQLKQPFFRGDAARSNITGNGLGLSIADRTAMQNGCKLTLSSTDTLFKADLRL